MPSAYAECLRGREPPWFLGGGVAGVFGQRQGAEGSSGLGFTDGGEVKVDEGGLEGSVTEVGGDLTNVGTAFQKVGGEAVTQSVDDELEMFLLRPHSTLASLKAAQVPLSFMGLRLSWRACWRGMPELFQPRPGAGKSQSGLRCHFQKARSLRRSAGEMGDVSFASSFGMFAVTRRVSISPLISVGLRWRASESRSPH